MVTVVYVIFSDGADVTGSFVISNQPHVIKSIKVGVGMDIQPSSPIPYTISILLNNAFNSIASENTPSVGVNAQQIKFNSDHQYNCNIPISSGGSVGIDGVSKDTTGVEFTASITFEWEPQ